MKSIYFEMKNGKRIHASIKGSGLPVLCLSGFGCSHYNYLGIQKYLSSKYQLILIDNRGFGMSEGYDLEEYSLEDVALDALSVMEQLGFEKFHVVGISMGGFLAQLLAIDYPRKVQSLSLLCTTSGGPDFVALPEMSEQTLRTFQSIPEPKRAEVAIEATVHPSLKKNDPIKWQRIVDLRMGNPARLEELLLQKKAIDSFLKEGHALERISCPTLILTGDSDRFVSPINSHRLYCKISNSSLEVIDQTDHLFFLERPEQVALRLSKFLNKHNLKNNKEVTHEYNT